MDTELPDPEPEALKQLITEATRVCNDIDTLDLVYKLLVYDKRTEP